MTAATARVKAARGGARAEWSDYADSRPEAAELAAVASALALARGRESSLHIVHVGTAAAAELAARRRRELRDLRPLPGLRPRGLRRKGRSPQDRSRRQGKGRARQALEASSPRERSTSSRATMPPPRARRRRRATSGPPTAGSPARVPASSTSYSEGLVRKRLSLPRFLEASSGSAARRYGLRPAKGSIAPGKDADLVLVDPVGHDSRSKERSSCPKARSRPSRAWPSRARWRPPTSAAVSSTTRSPGSSPSPGTAAS